MFAAISRQFECDFQQCAEVGAERMQYQQNSCVEGCVLCWPVFCTKVKEGLPTSHVQSPRRIELFYPKDSTRKVD